MDKEHIKGAAEKVSGSVKEFTGKVTGNTELEVKGKAEKLEGEVRTKVGDAKDAARDIADKAR